MIVDDKLLSKLEKLSALKIPDEKREKFKEQINEFLNFVDILDELDLRSSLATTSTLTGGTPLRSDNPYVNEEVIQTIIKHSPNSEQKYFVVPKIIE